MMNSEISTERPEHRPSAGSESLRPWQLFTLAGLVGATVVVFMSRGHTPAAVIVLSLIIFAAAGVGIAALRTFGPLAGRTFKDSSQLVGGRTRAALEREKALALRSIKELEFDRAMKKVSEKDFAEMAGRLRGRAARLIRQLDANAGYRQEIEQEIEKRIGVVAAPVAGSKEPFDVAQGGPFDAAQGKQDPAYVMSPSGVSCAACGTSNDTDARFCKGCGGRLEGAA